MEVTICKKMEPITELLKKEFEELSPDQERLANTDQSQAHVSCGYSKLKRNQGLHLDIWRSLSKTAWRSLGTVHQHAGGKEKVARGPLKKLWRYRSYQPLPQTSAVGIFLAKHERRSSRRAKSMSNLPIPSQQ